MNAGTQAFWFLRSNDWIRKEMRKALQLPANQMIPRMEELLNRAKSLRGEVTNFLEQKDAP